MESVFVTQSWPISKFLGGCAGSAEHGVAMTTPLALPEPAVCKKQPGRCLGKAQSARLMQDRPAPNHDRTVTANTPHEGCYWGPAVLQTPPGRRRLQDSAGFSASSISGGTKSQLPAACSILC